MAEIKVGVTVYGEQDLPVTMIPFSGKHLLSAA